MWNDQATEETHSDTGRETAPSTPISFALARLKVGLGEIYKAAHWAVTRVSLELDDAKPIERGGAFCFLLPRADGDHIQILSVLIGSPNADRCSELQTQAVGNANHLADKLERITSWVLRSRNTCCSGGAIRAGDFILSFNGINELADEASMLLAAVKLEWLTPMQAAMIANCSDNRLYLQVAASCDFRPA